jgi:hypothetical protein
MRRIACAMSLMALLACERQAGLDQESFDPDAELELDALDQGHADVDIDEVEPDAELQQEAIDADGELEMDTALELDAEVTLGEPEAPPPDLRGVVPGAFLPLAEPAPPARLLYTPSKGARGRGSFALVGQPAPELEVARWTEGTGPPPSIALGRGKVRHIYLFQGWCPGCTKRGFPVATKMEETFGDDEVEVIYVQTTFEGHSANDFQRARWERKKWRIEQRVGHDQPVNHDDHPRTMVTMRTGGTPWTVVLDPWGRVRFNDFTRSVGFHEGLVRSLIAEARLHNAASEAASEAAKKAAQP